MTQVLKLKLNEKTEALLPYPLRVLMLIYQLGECTLSDVVEASGGMSATTVTKYINELEKLGLVNVTRTKNKIGTKKKIITVTDKGLKVIDYIMKLNELLS